MKFDTSDRKLFVDAVNRFREDLQHEFLGLLGAVSIHAPPRELAAFLQRLADLLGVLTNPAEGVREIDDSYGPLLREALVRNRLSTAAKAEDRRAHVTHPELIERIEKDLEPFDAAMKKPWFREAQAATVPRTRDYFPIEDVERELAQVVRGPAAERAYDEKFHILQAPSLFLEDLDAARVASQIRDVSLGVAYLDIDEFKKLNTQHGEPFVDRNVLPMFMRRLEAHVYMRGHAYRFGGDEYVILLNNTSPTEALDSMDGLRKDLANLKYSRVDREVTVSIGLVIVTATCHLACREVEERAARAKNYAKERGRNRIATYEDPWFERLTISRS